MSLSELTFSAGKRIGNNLFFSNNRFNGLFKMNIQTMEPEFIMFFPEERISQNLLHSRCFAYENIIGFLPWLGAHIHLYDVQTKEMKTIQISGRNEFAFVDIYLRDSCLWIFPADLEHPLLKLNLESLMLEEVNGFREWCNDKLKPKESVAFWGIAPEENRVWLGVHGTNEIVEFNMDEETLKKHVTDIPDIHIVQKSQHGFWVIPTMESDGLYKWEPEKNTSVRHTCEGCRKVNGAGFISIAELQEETYAIPDKAVSILKLNKETGHFQKTSDYPVGFEIMDKSALKFLEYEIAEGQLVLFPQNSNGLLIISNEKTEIECKILKRTEIKFEEEPYKSYLRELHEDGIIMENDNISLSTFVEQLELFDSAKGAKKAGFDYGSLIYSRLRKH